MVDEDHIGKTCPFCQTPIKPNDQVIVCRECDMPHHSECWYENEGCTTYGCAGSPVYDLDWEPEEPVRRYEPWQNARPERQRIRRTRYSESDAWGSTSDISSRLPRSRDVREHDMTDGLGVVFGVIGVFVSLNVFKGMIGAAVIGYIIGNFVGHFLGYAISAFSGDD